MAKKLERFKEYPLDCNVLVGEYGTIKTYYKVLKHGYRIGNRTIISDELRQVKCKKHKSFRYVKTTKLTKIYESMVHRLVAFTWKNRSYKEGLVVNHIDKNTLNNCYKNLEWVSSQYNVAYSNGKAVKIGKKYYNSIHQASRITKISRYTIRKKYLKTCLV